MTGGAGFIGSHVVDALLETGADVRVLDALDPSVHGGIAPVLDERAELIVGNLNDPSAIDAAVAGVDAVCHQAARVGLGVDFSDVGRYVADNDVGTASLLAGLWRAGFRRRLVLASSMVIYGEGLAGCPEHGAVRPAPRDDADLAAGEFEPRCPRCERFVTWLAVDESTAPDPRNVYAATKLHQEHLCRLWAREAGASAIALRYHNVYGPRMPRDTPYAGVAAIFRSAVLAGQHPQVFEDGGQTRDFVHVRDVARANLLALAAEWMPRGEARVYNIASGQPRTVLDLARAVCGSGAGGASGAASALAPTVTGAWRAGDVRHIVASPARAADELGFRAEVSFEDGMAEFVDALGSGEPVAS
ncbi:MAG TPA: NAD-dependent epimerase/dehydratase family protein [Thermoleophilia bacterium]|nr:NAD-dependent epimerase/dehydratase family protein [Thermoleophilia bacterium]